MMAKEFGAFSMQKKNMIKEEGAIEVYNTMQRVEKTDRNILRMVTELRSPS